MNEALKKGVSQEPMRIPAPLPWQPTSLAPDSSSNDGLLDHVSLAYNCVDYIALLYSSIHREYQCLHLHDEANEFIYVIRKENVLTTCHFPKRTDGNELLLS